MKIKQDISIGENLKKLRKKAHLSQEEVAAMLELKGLSVSREMLSQMEQGRYSIRVSVLFVLKEIYKANWDDFFEGISFQHRIELEGSTCLYISKQVSFWNSCWRSGKNRFALFPGFSVASHILYGALPMPRKPFEKGLSENFQFCSFSANSFQYQYAPPFHLSSRPAAASQSRKPLRAVTDVEPPGALLFPWSREIMF